MSRGRAASGVGCEPDRAARLERQGARATSPAPTAAHVLPPVPREVQRSEKPGPLQNHHGRGVGVNPVTGTRVLPHCVCGDPAWRLPPSRSHWRRTAPSPAELSVVGSDRYSTAKTLGPRLDAAETYNIKRTQKLQGVTQRCPPPERNPPDRRSLTAIVHCLPPDRRSSLASYLSRIPWIRPHRGSSKTSGGHTMLLPTRVQPP